MKNKHKIPCCYINDLDVDCGSLAEYSIWCDINGVSSYTYSCVKHVGHLLTDCPEHRIFPIEMSLERELKDEE